MGGIREMQRLVTEFRAWLFLANTMLPTQGDLLGGDRDGGADTKGERGQRNPAGSQRSRRAQPMAALPGVRGKSQVSLPPRARIPRERGSVAGEACPVRHITPRGSTQAGLKLKILQEARTGQKLLPKECSYLCPADPSGFPALGQEEPWTGEGEKGCIPGEGQGSKCQVRRAVLSPMQ